MSMSSGAPLDAASAAAAAFVDEEEEWELPPPSMKTDDARTEEELTKDLYKVEQEIRTLRQVLETKERKAAIIRKKLGIGPLQLMSKDVANSFKTIKETSGAAVNKVTNSDTVQKLNQSYALQASKSAVSNAASYTRTSFSHLGSGVKSGIDSLKSSMMGFSYGVPAAGSNEAMDVPTDRQNSDAMFGGSGGDKGDSSSFPDPKQT